MCQHVIVVLSEVWPTFTWDSMYHHLFAHVIGRLRKRHAPPRYDRDASSNTETTITIPASMNQTSTAIVY